MKIYETKDFINHALNVMKIEIPEEEKDLIKFIKMREYGVAEKNKSLLFTANLQSCVSLIAWCKDFAFLSHMNVITCEPDFYINEERTPIKCRRIDDLYNEIQKNKQNIQETINIGIVLGVTPVDKKHKSRVVIEEDLKDLFERLRKDKISAIRIPDINAFSFILDSRNGSIITDGVEEKSKIIRLQKFDRKYDIEDKQR